MLTVVPAVIDNTAGTATWVVPGDQRWTVRTVCAVASTVIGGAPARAYALQVTDGTNLVANAGAADAGTEPAAVTITWANTPAGAITAGNVGASVAPFPNALLNPGYVMTALILNPAAGDQWASAYAWVNFDYTG